MLSFETTLDYSVPVNNSSTFRNQPQCTHENMQLLLRHSFRLRWFPPVHKLFNPPNKRLTTLPHTHIYSHTIISVHTSLCAPSSRLLSCVQGTSTITLCTDLSSVAGHPSYSCEVNRTQFRMASGIKSCRLCTTFSRDDADLRGIYI